MRFAFDHFDSDKDDYITAKDLVESFHREGKNFSEEDIYRMIEEAGVEPTAQIDFETFKNIVQQTEIDFDMDMDVEMSPQDEDGGDMVA